MIAIAKNEIEDMNVEGVDLICAEYTYADVQTQIKATVVKVLHLGKKSNLNKIRLESAWLPIMIVMKFTSHVSAEDNLFKCLDRRLRKDNFMKRIVKRAVSNPSFKIPVAEFIKEHVIENHEKVSLETVFSVLECG